MTDIAAARAVRGSCEWYVGATARTAAPLPRLRQQIPIAAASLVIVPKRPAHGSEGQRSASAAICAGDLCCVRRIRRPRSRSAPDLRFPMTAPTQDPCSVSFFSQRRPAAVLGPAIAHQIRDLRADTTATCRIRGPANDSLQRTR
jgi:hypothetical protein